MKYNYEAIKKAVISKGYRFSESGDYELNIVAIRTPLKFAKFFEDVLCVCYITQDENGTHQNGYLEMPCSTDPGLTILVKPITHKGVAYLVPDQYVDCWEMNTKALHNKWPALVLTKPVRYYRDTNREMILDFEPGQNRKGVVGCYYHDHLQPKMDAEALWDSSAGCLTINHRKDAEKLFWLCKKSAKKYGNRFTYTLLEEHDVL